MSQASNNDALEEVSSEALKSTGDTQVRDQHDRNPTIYLRRDESDNGTIGAHNLSDEAAVKQKSSVELSGTPSPLIEFETIFGPRNSTEYFDVSIVMEWKLYQFVKFEMDPEGKQKLGGMLVAVGAPETAWITRCRDYLQWFAPERGMLVLDLVEDLLSRQAQDYLHSSKERDSLSIELTSYMKDGTTQVSARGPARALIDVMNILIWLAATFRPFRYQGAQVLTSMASAKLQRSDNLNLISGSIRTNPAQPEQLGLCWARTYRGILALHFPVPAHEFFPGAEIPFDIMLALAGVTHEVAFRGKFSYYKGYNNVLFPTAVSVDMSLVSWHTTSLEEFERQFPDPGQWLNEEGDAVFPEGFECEFSPERPFKDNTEIAATSASQRRSRHIRHILGYTEQCKIAIGTEKYRLQVPNRRSGSTAQKSRLCLRRLGLNLGTSGLSIVSAGITVQVGFTASQVAQMDQTPSIYRQIDSAGRRPMVLYDTSRHIGYLVPELSVALHIVLSWFANLGGLREEELAKLPRASMASNGGFAARESIIVACKEDLQLHGVLGESWKFGDAVRDTLAALRSCRGLSTQTENEMSVWERLHRKDVLLYGWDMADCVANEEFMYRQEARIKMNATDSWVNHIARHPKMLVLFAKELQSPLILDRLCQICPSWNPLPRADLLLCSSQCIFELIQTCGGDEASGRLTNHECYFHQSEKGVRSFQNCTFDGQSRCNRMHVLSSERPKEPMRLPIDGAILFGSAKRSRKIRSISCQEAAGRKRKLSE